MINRIADPLMPNGISGDMRIFRIERGFIVSKQVPQGRLSHSGFGSQCLPTESRGYRLIVTDFRYNLSATICYNPRLSSYTERYMNPRL